MQIHRILLTAVLAAAGYLILRKYHVDPDAQGSRRTKPPLMPVIENLLHEHEGEDSPLVHAFEAALEQSHRA
jgi:hypothetical protein